MWKFVCEECKKNHHVDCDNVTNGRPDPLGTWCDCQHKSTEEVK